VRMDAGSEFERKPCHNATPRQPIDCILRVKTSYNVVVGIIRLNMNCQWQLAWWYDHERR